MNENKLLKIILAPRVSEKATAVGVYRQYVFKVAKKATKPEIVQAIKLLFNVDAISVRSLNVKGKKSSYRNIKGRCKDWKKAYVTIKEGQEIRLGGV